MAEPTVWIAEEEDYDDELGGWVCTGTFAASVQTEEAVLDEAEGLDVETALAWARARSRRVLIRYGTSGYFSAGEERVAGAPLWPPADLPDLVRRRTPDEAWKDRTEADPTIAWRVVAHLRPPRIARDDALIVDLARASGADEWDGHLIDQWVRDTRSGTVYAEIPGYRLHYSVQSSTPAQATGEVRRRLSAPDGWELSIAAEPA